MTVKFISERQNGQNILRIKSTEKTTRRGLRQGMFKAGHTLISAASTEILHGNKTGVIYIRRDRKGRKRRHQSSAPSETHANMTGALRRSLSFQMWGSNGIEFGYGVSGQTAPDYAPWVEFGTTKMKARPSLLNALESQEGNINQHLENEVRKVFE